MSGSQVITFQYLETGEDESRRGCNIPAGAFHQAHGVAIPRVGEFVTFSDPKGQTSYQVLAVNTLISEYEPRKWETIVTLGPAALKSAANLAAIASF